VDDREAFFSNCFRGFAITTNHKEYAIMSNEIYSKDNLANIARMNELAPDVMTAFWAFDKASVAAGAIPVKYKELIAVAVAVTTQCPYCIDIHTGNAIAAGVTEVELVEATMVAASLRAGGAVTHATHALSKFEESANAQVG
jgi:AhpD family alkylhydroperoxidase